MRRYARARGELEARLPNWPEVAAAIGALGIGLEDAEFVGGVLWYGLTHKRSEEHTSELQSLSNLVCRLLLGKNRSGRGGCGLTDGRLSADLYLVGECRT